MQECVSVCVTFFFQGGNLQKQQGVLRTASLFELSFRSSLFFSSPLFMSFRQLRPQPRNFAVLFLLLRFHLCLFLKQISCLFFYYCYLSFFGAHFPPNISIYQNYFQLLFIGLNFSLLRRGLCRQYTCCYVFFSLFWSWYNIHNRIH